MIQEAERELVVQRRAKEMICGAEMLVIIQRNCLKHGSRARKRSLDIYFPEVGVQHVDPRLVL